MDLSSYYDKNTFFQFFSPNFAGSASAGSAGVGSTGSPCMGPTVTKSQSLCGPPVAGGAKQTDGASALHIAVRADNGPTCRVFVGPVRLCGLV